MRKAKDFMDMSVEELQSLHGEMDRELFQLRNTKMQTKTLEKPHLIKQTKKERARLLTVLNHKQRSASTTAG